MLLFLNRLKRSRAGNAAIEAALGLPVLITFAAGLSEFGYAMWIQNTLQYAAESAARCAAINTTTCGTTANIQAYAVSQVVAINVTASNFTATTPACGKQVTASYVFDGGIPLLLGDWNPTLTAIACHPF
jgi:Flp pilus assembly protein TadG